MDRYSAKNGQRQFCEHYFSFMNKNVHLWLEWWTPEGWADRKNQRKVVVGVPNRTGIDMVLFIEMTLSIPDQFPVWKKYTYIDFQQQQNLMRVTQVCKDPTVELLFSFRPEVTNSEGWAMFVICTETSLPRFLIHSCCCCLLSFNHLCKTSVISDVVYCSS